MRCQFRATEVLSTRGQEATSGELPRPIKADEDVWRCPRHQEEESEYCLLHDKREVDERSLSSYVRQSLTASSESELFATNLDGERYREEAKRLFGLRGSSIVLRNDIIDGADTHDIDFRYADLSTVDIRESRIEFSLRFDDADIDSLIINEATINGGITAESLTTDLLQAREAAVSNDLNLIAATVGRIDFQEITVNGRLTLNDSSIKSDANFTEASIGGRFEYKRGEVGRQLRCPGIKLRGENLYSNTSELTLRGTTVESDILFEKAQSPGSFLLNDLESGGDLILSDAAIDGHLWLGAIENEATRLGAVKVSGSIRAVRTTVKGEVDMTDSDTQPGPTVGGTVDLSGLRVEGGLRLRPLFSNGKVPVVLLEGANISSGHLRSPADGPNVLFDLADATIGNLALGDGLVDTLQQYRMVETTFNKFHFSRSSGVFDGNNWEIHTTYEGGERDLSMARSFRRAAALAGDLLLLFEKYDSITDLYDGGGPVDPNEVIEILSEHMELEKVCAEESIREEVLPADVVDREGGRKGIVRQLAETATDGVNNDAEEIVSEERVIDILTELTGSSGDTDPVIVGGQRYHRLSIIIAEMLAEPEYLVPSHGDLEATYLLAKNGANEVGDSNAASQFFIKEMKYRRKKHFENAMTPDESLPNRVFTLVYRWGGNASLGLTAGYGERPQNVLLTSSAVIGLFSFLYYFVVSAPPYGEDIGYLILSFESFTTLVLGGAESITNPTVRILASIEGFLGAFLIALFLFTLTRSVDR